MKFIIFNGSPAGNALHAGSRLKSPIILKQNDAFDLADTQAKTKKMYEIIPDII